MPKVSVIVPTYKTAKYLPKCLDSIINQTYKDFEIILVSDGPEEDNLICDEYKKKYSFIKVIKDVRKGLGGARNAGIDIANGSYICFIDSDDSIKIDYLEKMVNAMESDNSIDIVQCGTKTVFEDKTNEKILAHDEHYFRVEQFGKIELEDKIFGNMNVGSWNKLYRKDLIKKYNLRFPEKMRNEDAFFTWAYWSISRNMYCIPDKLYNYLRRNSSLMAKTFAQGMEEEVLDHLKIGEMLYNFLIQNNLYEKREDAFLRAYIVCWFFVRDYGSKKYKQIGHEIAREFLSDKNIPIQHYLLRDIVKYPYKRFRIKEHGKDTFVQKVFSLKNSTDKTHKIVTFLGFRIKFRRKIK